MQETIVDFETAKLAHSFGFRHLKANCYGDNMAYDTGVQEGTLIRSGEALNYILAPTQALLQKWLREIYNKDVIVRKSFSRKLLVKKYKVSFDGVGTVITPKEEFDTYEEALERGLKGVLEKVIR